MTKVKPTNGHSYWNCLIPANLAMTSSYTNVHAPTGFSLVECFPALWLLPPDCSLPRSQLSFL